MPEGQVVAFTGIDAVPMFVEAVGMRERLNSKARGKERREKTRLGR